MRVTSPQTFALVLACGALGCSDAPPADGSNPGTGGGVTATGGASTGGSVGTGGVVGSGGSGVQPTGGSSSSGGSTGSGGAASGGTGNSNCTNIRPTGTEWDEATCDQWASETSECNNAWMINGNYCNQSCGRCTPGGSGGTGAGGSGAGGTGAGGTGSTGCGATTPLSGGTQHCSSGQGTLGNGVAWSVWLSNSTTGTNCGTFYNVDSALKASWNMNDGGDFLARAGLQWNKTQTYTELGTISADYAYTKTGVNDTTSYIGIYGWSSGPLVEFYIVEEWIGWNPASNATKKGTFSVDGGTYDVYTHTQVSQPSIEGTQTFPQYFSIRQNAPGCGHISITEHFNAWAGMGMNLGKMYEAKILVEAMGGTGTVDFTKAKLTAQ